MRAQTGAQPRVSSATGAGLGFTDREVERTVHQTRALVKGIEPVEVTRDGCVEPLRVFGPRRALLQETVREERCIVWLLDLCVHRACVCVRAVGDLARETCAEEGGLPLKVSRHWLRARHGLLASSTAHESPLHPHSRGALGRFLLLF